MRFLITGGAGFIGSHLVNSILDHELGEVSILDNFDSLLYDPKLKHHNIEYAKKSKKFNLYEGDIRDQRKVKKLFENLKPDILIHLAAMAGVRHSFKNPMLYWDVNLNGTANLFHAALKNKLKKIIFASSSSVYGNSLKVPLSESDFVDTPISYYATTKRAGELMCYTFNHICQIPVVALRFFTVYGPAQRPEMAIATFTRLIDRGEKIDLYGDGLSKRDYTYIDDIVRGMIGIINHDIKGYEIFNLGNSSTITLIDLVHTIESELGKKANINYMPKQPGDVEQTFADINKATKVFGFKPAVNIQDGIKRYVEWYKKQKQK
jgi:UDP-glucuronate 4-epimerase